MGAGALNDIHAARRPLCLGRPPRLGLRNVQSDRCARALGLTPQDLPQQDRQVKAALAKEMVVLVEVINCPGHPPVQREREVLGDWGWPVAQGVRKLDEIVRKGLISARHLAPR